MLQTLPLNVKRKQHHRQSDYKSVPCPGKDQSKNTSHGPLKKYSASYIATNVGLHDYLLAGYAEIYGKLLLILCGEVQYNTMTI